MHQHTHCDHAHHAASNIKIAFFLNFVFSIIEIIGGLLTNSIAILSDAVHDLGDTASIGFAWLMENYSQKKRTDVLTYGYKRFSLVGAIVSSFILFLGSIIILSQAVVRLFNPQSVHAQGMLGLAVLGILINGIAVFRLRNGKKINERVIFLHLLEDVLGWVAVFCVSILLLFFDLPILDPLLSIVITIFIISKIIPNIKQTLKIFLQYSPADYDLQELKQLIMQNEWIEDVHDVHLWSLDGHYTVFSCHVAINQNLSLVELEQVKGKMKRILNSRGIAHITIEFEPDSKICDECGL